MMKMARFGSPLLGLGLLLIAGAAYAQSGVLATSPGPMFWINLLLGLLLTIVGAYIKGLVGRMDKSDGRVDRLENKMIELQTLVLRDYHSKGDLGEILGEIKAAIKAMHQRFDKFEGLYGR